MRMAKPKPKPLPMPMPFNQPATMRRPPHSGIGPASQQLPLFHEPATVALRAATTASAPEPAVAPGATIVSTPLRVAPEAASEAVFRHPQADREIRLEDRRVAYALRRSRRSSIGFVVGTEGLSVNAPKWIGVGAIEAALREKATWIVRKLHEQAERGKRLQASRIDWRDGAMIPVLGRDLTVVLDPRLDPRRVPRTVVVSTRNAPAAANGWTIDSLVDPATNSTTDPVMDPATALAANPVNGSDADMTAAPMPGPASADLHVGLPRTATPAQIKRAVQGWLQQQARLVFQSRCAHFAPKLAVRPTRLSLSSAASRWGSASANGSIRLNWRLMHLAPACIDYVVVHELAHLREMNHSPRFWAVVRSVLPDYELARAALKDALLPLLD